MFVLFVKYNVFHAFVYTTPHHTAFVEVDSLKGFYASSEFHKLNVWMNHYYCCCRIIFLIPQRTKTHKKRSFSYISFSKSDRERETARKLKMKYGTIPNTIKLIIIDKFCGNWRDFQAKNSFS